MNNITMKKVNFISLLIGGGVILIISAACGYKFYNNIKTKFDSDKLLIASLYEAYNIGQKERIDSAEHHVLFLVNSITHVSVQKWF